MGRPNNQDMIGKTYAMTLNFVNSVLIEVVNPTSHGVGTKCPPYFCIEHNFLLRADKVTSLSYFS